MDAKPPFVRSPYNYNMNAAGDESGLKCTDKSLAQQHMADECDINKLVERFVVTGEMPQLHLPPMQGDFTAAPTYQEALNLMVEANRSFMQLDAKIRARFDNDPGQFVAFCSDEANRDELRQMGLFSADAMAAHRAKEAQTLEETIQARVKAAQAAKGAQDAPKGDTQKGVT